jgi:ComF family protein
MASRAPQVGPPMSSASSRTSILRGAAAALADLVIPPLCLSCHRPLSAHDSLCAGCWSQIAFIRAPLCDRLGIPLPFDLGEGPAVSAAATADPPDYDRARFDGPMRALVHDLKFRDRHDARRLLGRWLTEAGGDLLHEASVVIPVPLSRWRLIGRRFNQAAVLAREVSRLSGIRFDPLALDRRRRTPPQVGLSRQQRRDNVAGAFTVAPGAQARVTGAAIVIVDDVITTGATVNACARALKRAGARRVDVLALAMVTDPALLSP